MNSVHLLTQKKYRVENRFENQVGCTECTVLANPGAQAVRPAPRPRACRAPAAYAPRALRAAACCPRARARPRAHARSPRLLPRAHALQRACACAAQRPCCLRAPSMPACRALPARPARTHRAPSQRPASQQPSHNTILLYCSQKLAISVTIQFLYRDTAFPACNTPLTLQYKTFLHPIACNKTLILQYNFYHFSHNITGQ